MDKMKMESVDINASNIEKIGELFPNCITEMIDEEKSTLEHKVYKKGINFELLKQMLSEDVLEGDEAYEFTWVGKKASIVEANKPIRKTLRPCKEESVNWDTTENMYIEGDNLEVLKLLQESYLGKIKMIYIDPPYNTGNDFIYNDDFKMDSDEYKDEIGEVDEEGNRLFKNTDANGRFHSDWCSMIYSRLMLARNLLSEDGVIFISIDDNEIEQLNVICKEIFGEKNFIANLIWKSKSGGANDSRYYAIDHEYVLVYVKSSQLFYPLIDREAEVSTTYNRKDEKGEYALDRLDKQSIRYSAALDYEIVGPDGKIYKPQHKNPNYPNATWRWSKEHVQSSFDELVFAKGCVYTKNYKKEGSIARSLLLDDRFGRTRTGKTDCYALFKGNYFSNPKPIKLIRYLNLITSKEDDIILDFFSGSATTAHAVMQLNAEDGGNRKFIMVQLPEKTDEKSEAYKAGYKNICEIGKERIRRAGKKILEENKDKEGIENLDIGFRVFKLDDSNMTDVYYSPDEYSQNLISMLESNIKSDRSDLDLLFGCLLEWGLPLSLPYSSEQMKGYTIHNYNGGDLIACFDENISDSVIKAIAKKQPLHAVFRDSSFTDSPSKINVGEIFKLLAPDTRVKVI